MKYKEVMQNPNITWISNDAISKRINAEFYDVEIGNVVNKMKQVFGDNIKNLTEFIILKDTGRNYLDTNQSNSYKYLKVNNLKEVLPDYSSLSYINKEDINTKDKLLEVGDILFVRVGVTSGVSSIIASKDVRGCFSDNIIRIRLNQDILNPFYCSVFLSSKYGKTLINRHLKGTARPLISYELFEDVLIPIPSPEIQKYIGDKVRRAEELREESKLLREEAENIIKVQLLLDKNQSLYNNNAGNPSLEFTKYPINLFVKPKDITERIDSKSYHPEYFETLDFLNNNKFKVMKLYNVIEDYSTGISSPKYTDDGIRILMTKNIKNDAIDLECKLVNRKVETKYRVNYGDVLITTYGGPSIGKVDIFTSKEECVYDYTILKLKFKSDYNPFFMTLLLRSKLIQNQIRNLIKGTTGITFVIPKEILNINIPIFDKDIQDEVGDIYKKSLECIDISKQLIQEAKQDVEDLIEGNFDMSKLNETTTESR